MISPPPHAETGERMARPEVQALSVVAGAALLASTLPRWFSVLVKYPTDQVLSNYGVLAFNRGSLHSYNALGWSFEVLIFLTGVVALTATVYGSFVMASARSAANAVIACGLLALCVVVLASITFQVANPRSSGRVLGSDLRFGPGAIAAAVSAIVILVSGIATRRALAPPA